MSLSNVLTIPTGGNSAPAYYGFFKTFVQDFVYSIEYWNAGTTEIVSVPVLATTSRTVNSSSGIAYTQVQGSETNHTIIVQNPGLYAINQEFKKQIITNNPTYNYSFFSYKWQLLVNNVVRAEVPLYNGEFNSDISCILNLTAGAEITNKFVITITGYDATTLMDSSPLMISTNIHSLF